MASEPIHDIAHLAHVELLTPKFEESRRFFIDVMGMTQSGEKGDSVFLRGWDDYEQYSLKLTAAKTSGLGHAAFRTRSPQALERRAAALKGSGFGIGMATNSRSTTKPNGMRPRPNSSRRSRIRRSVTRRVG